VSDYRLLGASSLNPEFHKFIKLLRWMKTRKGLTFLCYKNELGHKQIFLNGINWLKKFHRKTQNIC
jgi:hypothetical protein